jgi:flagellin
MTIGIRNNLVSRTAAGSLQRTQQGLARSAQKMSSGSRIDRVGEDASGSAVAFTLTTRVHSIRQAVRNANDGLSLLSTVEGAANTFADTLDRMRELAVQSSSETLGTTERNYLSDEFDNHIAELRRLVFTTKFNGLTLSSGISRTVQVGADSDSSSEIDITGVNLKSTQIQVASSDIGTSADAQDAIDDVDSATDFLNGQRTNLGGEWRRLESAISNANAEIEALSSAASRIHDTDYAEETAHMTALQIKNQAGTAALAQAKNLAAPVIDLISR